MVAEEIEVLFLQRKFRPRMTPIASDNHQILFAGMGRAANRILEALGRTIQKSAAALTAMLAEHRRKILDGDRPLVRKRNCSAQKSAHARAAGHCRSEESPMS